MKRDVKIVGQKRVRGGTEFTVAVGGFNRLGHVVVADTKLVPYGGWREERAVELVSRGVTA
jgi:hypothetical protein